MTQAGTNPQVIREVRIDSEKTVGELLETARIVFELQEVKGSLFKEDRTSPSPERQLKEVLHTGDFLEIAGSGRAEDHFYIEVLAESEGVEGTPELVRFRKIPYRNRSVHFSESAYNSDVVVEFEKYMNREIRKVFAPGTVAPDLDWKIARPLKTMLDGRKVAELKSFAKENRLDVNQYLKKADLIRDLIRVMDLSGFWEKIINRMSVREYFQFKEICKKNGNFVQDDEVEVVFPILSESWLMEDTYWNGVIIAKELMEFYEKWLESGKEQQYLGDHAAEICFIAAGNLYGFVDQGLFAELYQKLYPDTDKEQKNIWRIISQNVSACNMKKIFGTDVFYHTLLVSGNSAKGLYQAFLTSGRFHYVPGKKELMELACSDLLFPEKDAESLQNILEQKFFVPRQNARYIIRELAKGIHIGIPTVQLIEYLRKAVSANRRNMNFGEATAILDRAQKCMRKISLGGFTEQELDSQMSKTRVVRAERKIYPNDPCPCGSGKKYKNCCGRR